MMRSAIFLIAILLIVFRAEANTCKIAPRDKGTCRKLAWKNCGPGVTSAFMACRRIYSRWCVHPEVMESVEMCIALRAETATAPGHSNEETRRICRKGLNKQCIEQSEPVCKLPPLERNEPGEERREERERKEREERERKERERKERRRRRDEQRRRREERRKRETVAACPPRKPLEVEVPLPRIRMPKARKIFRDLRGINNALDKLSFVLALKKIGVDRACDKDAPVVTTQHFKRFKWPKIIKRHIERKIIIRTRKMSKKEMIKELRKLKILKRKRRRRIRKRRRRKRRRRKRRRRGRRRRRRRGRRMRRVRRKLEKKKKELAKKKKDLEKRKKKIEKKEEEKKKKAEKKKTEKEIKSFEAELEEAVESFSGANQIKEICSKQCKKLDFSSCQRKCEGSTTTTCAKKCEKVPLRVCENQCEKTVKPKCMRRCDNTRHCKKSCKLVNGKEECSQSCTLGGCFITCEKALKPKCKNVCKTIFKKKCETNCQKQPVLACDAFCKVRSLDKCESNCESKLQQLNTPIIVQQQQQHQEEEEEEEEKQRSVHYYRDMCRANIGNKFFCDPKYRKKRFAERKKARAQKMAERRRLQRGLAELSMFQQQLQAGASEKRWLEKELQTTTEAIRRTRIAKKLQIVKTDILTLQKKLKLATLQWEGKKEEAKKTKEDGDISKAQKEMNELQKEIGDEKKKAAGEGEKKKLKKKKRKKVVNNFFGVMN